MLVVMDGKLDFGIEASCRFGLIEESAGKLVRKIVYPRNNALITSHINPIFKAVDAFLISAQSYARTL